MVNRSVIRTEKLTDKKILQLFLALEDKFGVQSGKMAIGTAPINYKDKEEAKLLKLNSNNLTSADFVALKHKFTVRYREGICKDINNLDTTRSPSAYYDEIIIEFTNQNNANQQIPSAAEAIECRELINSFLKTELPQKVQDDADDAVALLKNLMANLSDQQKEMVSDLDKRRKQLEKEHEKKTDHLIDEHHKKLEELTHERQTYQEDFEKKKIASEEKHDQRNKALDQRETELDNRNHMHVRRDLRENINVQIKERLKETIVPKSALFMRMGVFFLAIFAALILGYVSFVSLSELTGLNKQNLFSITGNIEASNRTKAEGNAANITTTVLDSYALWFLIIKSFLSSLGAFAALFYAISWLRHLYENDVRTQKDLEKYAYDINRASWAIETILELQTSKGELLPETWINAVCNNLFVFDGEKNDSFENPLEAILKSSARVQLGPEGAKFDINGRGANKLADKV